jgi:predicted NACHT family NTPase
MAAEHGVDTSSISTRVAQRAIDRILDFAEAKVKQKWAQHKNKNTALFADYIQAQSKRCALVRTLIYDKQSAHLPDIYVPLRARMLLGFGRRSHFEELTTEDIINLFREERDQKETQRKTLAAVLSAPAGAGKTFFMRNLYIKLAASSQSKVPLFLDARELNRIPLTDFAGMITVAFRIAGHDFSHEQAVDALKAGIFQILIDGFDELRVSHEQHYANVLERATEEFELCPLVVSGRPSELLHGFTYIQQCELLPLDPEQSVELIQRLEFHGATKSSFIALMHKELFASHKEFLELPLLCIVMLLTYSDAGRISHRTHEFYEDAFNALWSKHDARKEAGYEREKYTGLDKDDFIKLLSAFCASSYVSEHFSMREAELNSHLARAKKLTDIPAKEEDFVRDMTTSTSLLVLDGNAYRFSHRSFQEYFCARYVLSLADGDIGKGIEAVSSRYETDTVLDFLRSMNTERFETAWVIPKLSAILPRLRKGEQSFTSYKKVFSSAEGDFLRKLREVYATKPSSEALAGAIAARQDMGLPAVRSLYDDEGDPQWNLLLKDISSFETLLEKLTKKYSARAVMRDALFGPSGASLKSVSKKPAR